MENLPKFKNNWIRWTATIGAFSLMMLVGIHIGWTAPNMRRFSTDGESSIKLTKDQISWSVALTGIGGCMGAVTGAMSIEHFGSRGTIKLTLFLMIFKWMMLLFADSALIIYAFRLIGGTTNAMTFCCFSLYLGEISKPEIRGTMISIAVSGFSFGITLGTVIESYVSTYPSTWIYLTICFVTVSLFTWLPETPYELVKKGDFSAAESSIISYLPFCDVNEKMEDVKTYVVANTDKSFKLKLLDLIKPVERKSLLLIMLLYGLPHASGALVLTSYREIIIKDSKVSFIKTTEANICMNVIISLFSLTIVKLIDRLGRRVLYIISGVGTSLAMTGIGVHFFLIQAEIDVAHFQWVPLTCALLYSLSYCVGYQSVPAAVLSELFPSHMKSAAACVASLSTSFVTFTIAKMYQPIIDKAGEMYAFWFYGALSFMAVPVAIFLLPETKKKSFLQIQTDLRRNRLD